MKSEALDLFLFVDKSDYVWYSTSNQLPICSFIKTQEFVKLEFIQKFNTIRLIGCHNNVKILVCLYLLKKLKQIQSLKVCSPITYVKAIKNDNPELVLINMNKLDSRPPSLGGWHEFDVVDYSSYLLADKVNSNSNQIENAFLGHPLAISLSFINNIDILSCAKLIATILDPRWFIDVDHPNKNHKLESFLGLVPRIYKLVLDSNKIDSLDYSKVYNFDKSKLVLNCWKTSLFIEQMDKPGNFLWRVAEASNSKSDYLEYLLDNNGRIDGRYVYIGERAGLRACQTFVSFVKNNWLDTINQYRVGPNSESLFVPEYFFKYKWEADAYKAHIQEKKLRLF